MPPPGGDYLHLAGSSSSDVSRLIGASSFTGLSRRTITRGAVRLGMDSDHSQIFWNGSSSERGTPRPKALSPLVDDAGDTAQSDRAGLVNNDLFHRTHQRMTADTKNKYSDVSLECNA
jgi:hypothetical protein